MEKKKNSEKLKDPRWQKLRLQIFERDEFMCQRCQDTESTLNVHHLKYTTGKEPWEYPMANFITLCESCHEHEYEVRGACEKRLLEALKEKGFMSEEVDLIATSFSKLKILYAPEVTVSVIDFALTYAFGEIADWFWKETSKNIKNRGQNNEQV